MSVSEQNYTKTIGTSLRAGYVALAGTSVIGLPLSLFLPAANTRFGAFPVLLGSLFLLAVLMIMSLSYDDPWQATALAAAFGLYLFVFSICILSLSLECYVYLYLYTFFGRNPLCGVIQ